MAIQIIDDPSRHKVSESIGNALSTGLQNLVSHKLNAMNKQREHEDLQRAFPEVPAGAINFLMQQPPKERLQYLEAFAMGMQNEQQQIQEKRVQQEQGLQALLGQQQEMQQQSQIPYAPGFQGQKQPQYGGQEQQQVAQQIQQAQQQLAQPRAASKQSLLKGIGSSSKIGQSGIVDTKRQAQIDKKNAPFNKDIDKFREQGEEIVNDARTALDLIDSGKVQFGLVGSILDKIPLGSNLMNDETQQFVSTINDLVDKDSAFTKGVATNFKIKLKQAAKAHLGLSQESAKKVVERILREKTKFLDLAQARDQIIEENNGIEPDNLSMLTRKRYETWERDKGPNEDPSEYSDDAIIRKNNVLYEKSPDRKGWTIYKGAL